MAKKIAQKFRSTLLSFSLIAFLFLSLFYSRTVSAGSKTGADFLKIPVGARAMALGQTYTALANDQDSLNWNPAGIGKMAGDFRSSGLTFSHQALFSENNLDHLGVAIPGDHLTVGLNVVRFSVPDQQMRGNDRSMNGTFSAGDLMLGSALAYNFQSFQIGTQLKYISEKLAGNNATTMAVDLGFLSLTPIKNLSIGGSVLNLGKSLNFVNESLPLPITISMGAAYKLRSPITLSVDFRSRPQQNQKAISLGTEFQTSQIVTLRAGYLAKLVDATINNQTSETNRGNLTWVPGLSGGIGLQFNNLTLDYAMSPFGELGITHSFTVSTRLGGYAPQRQIKFPSKDSADKNKNQLDPNRTIINFDQSQSETPFIKK